MLMYYSYIYASYIKSKTKLVPYEAIFAHLGVTSASTESTWSTGSQPNSLCLVPVPAGSAHSSSNPTQAGSLSGTLPNVLASKSPPQP